MAIAYLNTGNGSLAAANWSDATGFADNATLVIRDGNTNITAGLNTTGDTTNGIDYLQIGPGFSGDLGTVSTNFQVEFDATYTAQDDVQFLFQGSGRCYVSCDTCAVLVVDCAGTIYLNGGTWTTVYVRRGSVVVGASATVGTVYQTGGRVTAEDGTDFTLYEIAGGTAEIERGATTVNTGEGRGNLTIADQSGTTGTINIRGSTVNLRRGDVTTINGYKGVLDERPAEEAITVTTLNRYAGLVDYENKQFVTRTNSNSPGGSAIINAPSIPE